MCNLCFVLLCMYAYLAHADLQVSARGLLAMAPKGTKYNREVLQGIGRRYRGVTPNTLKHIGFATIPPTEYTSVWAPWRCLLYTSDAADE